MVYYYRCLRGVAQFGRALGSGPRGRKFKSSHSDQNKMKTVYDGLFCFISEREGCPAYAGRIAASRSGNPMRICMMCRITTAILLHFIACDEVRRNAFKFSPVKMVIEKTAIAVFFISSSMLQNIHKHQLTFPSFHGKIIR